MKRFNCLYGEQPFVEHEDGYWVRESDHALLKKELELVHNIAVEAGIELDSLKEELDRAVIDRDAYQRLYQSTSEVLAEATIDNHTIRVDYFKEQDISINRLGKFIFTEILLVGLATLNILAYFGVHIFA